MKNQINNQHLRRFDSGFKIKLKMGHWLIFPLTVAILLFLVRTTRLYPQFYARKYAVAVGVDQYPHSRFANLHYARKDVEGVAQLLRTLGFTVYPLYDTNATKRNIISLLEDRLAPRLTSHDAALFFFAGHGTTRRLANQDWGYIIPYDGTVEAATYISMEEIHTLSRKMGSARHQVFIMDCCYGGHLGSRSDKIPTTVPNYLQDVGSRVARQILKAGGKDQQVVDGGPFGHSVFTGYLIKAVKEGLADINSDGWISFSELVTYIQTAATRPNQTPGWGTMPGHELGEFLWQSLRPPVTPSITQPLPPAPGTSSEIDQLGIKWVFVPGGRFQMGSEEGQDDEKPVHWATVSDFWMSAHEITFSQYDAFCEETGKQKPDDEGWGRGSHPVIYVNWSDALAFCEWLSGKIGAQVRLPTEAEWEYAARAGGKSIKYPWGNNFDGTKVNFADKNASPFSSSKEWDDGFANTAPVGSFPPNDLGLFDMAGNVWEWCQDWYDNEYYRKSPAENPKGPTESKRVRVLRGGSWLSSEDGVRCSNRSVRYPVNTNDNVGFRCVR